MKDFPASAIVRTLPPSGEILKMWDQRVMDGRLRLLIHCRSLHGTAFQHGPTSFGESIARFLDLDRDTQHSIGMTSEFAAWLFTMRKWLEGGGLGPSDPAPAELLSQFNQFLLLPHMRLPLGEACFDVPVTEKYFVNLTGSMSYVKLPTRMVGDSKSVVCHVRYGELVFSSKSGGVWSPQVSEPMTAGDQQKRIEVHSEGVHNLYRFHDSQAYLGAPVFQFYPFAIRRIVDTLNQLNHGVSALDAACDNEAFIADLDAALKILRNVHDDFASRTDAYHRLVFPIEAPGLYSYSELSIPGAAFLTCRAGNPLWHAELLLHEASHNWLASLVEMLRFVKNDPAEVYPSPWRQDLRPIQGILFGTHAFAVVLCFFCRALQYDVFDRSHLAQRIFLESCRVRHGYETLRSRGHFTKAGTLFLEDLARLIAETDETVANLSSADRKLPDLNSSIWPTSMAHWISGYS